jgi:hypothetical protein
MNLFEFLENWDGNTQVLIENNSEKIFSGKIADMSENVACRYWIQKAGVEYNNEIMHISVESMKVK